MDKPLISIGLLTYNHEKYILDALKSLLFQEYEQIELIILDDASTDTTPLLIDQYMEKLRHKFVRVVYIKNKKNCGSISRNFNCLLKKMKGKFCFEFSGDDVLLPQCIQILYSSLQVNPECMGIHANVIQVEDTYSYGNGIDENRIFWKNRESGVENNNFFYQLMYDNRIVALTVMLRREVFDKYGFHDENILYEDYEYWLRLSRKEKFCYNNKPVALYRKARTSITNFGRGDSCYKLRTAIFSDYKTKRKYIEYLTEYEKVECWKVFYTRYTQLCMQHQYQAGLKWLENKKKQEKIEFKENSIDYIKGYEKCCEELDLLTMWIKIKRVPNILGNYLKRRGIYRVAIYGYYSRMANILEKELLNDGILISYIIDRKGRLLESKIPAYVIEDPLPKVDAIIIAPLGLYEETKLITSKKNNVVFIDLKQIIRELVYEIVVG